MKGARQGGRRKKHRTGVFGCVRVPAYEGASWRVSGCVSAYGGRVLVRDADTLMAAYCNRGSGMHRAATRAFWCLREL